MIIEYVATNEALITCINNLDKQNEIAIDLEFDKNRYRYGFNMCLMQIYDGATTYLVDPLSPDLEVEMMFPVLENPAIQKVVFAFGEDLRLFHSMGCFPKNIVDLDIASSLLNYPPSSLTNLLLDVLSVEPGGSSQQSNWFRRPLSDKQKEYAASDVYHLLDLKKSLIAEAKDKERAEWIHQENALHDDLDYSDEDHNNFIKDKDKKGQSEHGWFIFTRLMEFFDTVAKKYNKPAYQIINKEFIKELAKDPSRIDDWEHTRGVYGRLKNKDFKSQLQAVLHQAIADANAGNLAKNEPAEKRMSQQEYRAFRAERNRIGQIKAKVFKPLQDHIKGQLGTHTKSFILPNRLVTELITANARELPPYKKQLFQDYAADLNVEIHPYLD